LLSWQTTLIASVIRVAAWFTIAAALFGTCPLSVGDLERRAVFRTGAAVIVDARGVACPSHSCTLAMPADRARCGGGRAQRVHPDLKPELRCQGRTGTIFSIKCATRRHCSDVRPLCVVPSGRTASYSKMCATLEADLPYVRTSSSASARASSAASFRRRNHFSISSSCSRPSARSGSIGKSSVSSIPAVLKRAAGEIDPLL
jgi:hypothetical protein